MPLETGYGALATFQSLMSAGLFPNSIHPAWSIIHFYAINKLFIFGVVETNLSLPIVYIAFEYHSAPSSNYSDIDIGET